MATTRNQDDLIGQHPSNKPLVSWLDYTDLKPTARKKHRALQHKSKIDRTEVIEWLAYKLIHHHYSEIEIGKLKSLYSKIHFKRFAEATRRLPRAADVMKGNFAEILLIEYIEACQNKPLVKAYKLRYNTNVDQAMKGDDLLMLDVTEIKTKSELKCFLGESKFRTTPDKKVVEDIAESLSKKKKPLSYSFLLSLLRRDKKTENIADLLDKIVLREIKARQETIFTGFLLSNGNTAKVVENNLDSDNPQMVFISLGIDDPVKLVQEAYKRAEALILTPKKL